MPTKIPYTPEKEEVKRRCRELISKWGLLKRQQKMLDERLTTGSAATHSSAIAQLMKRAEAHLEKKHKQDSAAMAENFSSLENAQISSDCQPQAYRASEIETTGVKMRDTLRRRLVELLRQARLDLLIERNDKEERKDVPFGEAQLLINEEWPLECALRLENHMWSKIAAGKAYRDKSRSLLFNL